MYVIVVAERAYEALLCGKPPCRKVTGKKECIEDQPLLHLLTICGVHRFVQNLNQPMPNKVEYEMYNNVGANIQFKYIVLAQCICNLLIY